MFQKEIKISEIEEMQQNALQFSRPTKTFPV